MPLAAHAPLGLIETPIFNENRGVAIVTAQALEDGAIGDMMQFLRRSNRAAFRDRVIAPLLEAGLFEMTIPDKPRSSPHRDRTTGAGRCWRRARERRPLR